MISPRDPGAAARLLDERRARWREAFDEAIEDVYTVMHVIDGSMDPGEHQRHLWTEARATVAAQHIETARLFIEKLIEEAR